MWIALFLAAGTFAYAETGGPVSWFQTMLWQEHFFWDALLAARDKLARISADPNLLPAVRTIAQQVASQAANLQQIEKYTKTQQDNIRFALKQGDPSHSLAVIRGNLETLTKATNQVRSNLYYLTARCRIASSQALPDPELTKTVAVLINQVEAVQAGLDNVYADAAGVQSQIEDDARIKDKALRYDGNLIVRSVTRTQDAVSTVYDSAYELYLRSQS